MTIFVFMLFIPLILSSSEKTMLRNNNLAGVQESGPNSDYEDFAQVLKDQKDGKGFYFKGILRQMFAFIVDGMGLIPIDGVLPIPQEATLQDIQTNVVCSPVAAALSLGKLMLGARKQGLQELVGVIGIENESGEGNEIIDLVNIFKQLIYDLKFLPGVKLDLASKIFMSSQAEINELFSSNTRELFNSSVEQVCFKNATVAAHGINNWINNLTEGKIPSVLTPEQLEPEPSIVIINAVYFKGKWHKPFNRVEDGDFFAPSGGKKVQLMMREGFYKYVRSDILNAQIIEIPYEGLKSSFIIVLPFDKNGLPLLLNALKLAPILMNTALRYMTKTLVSLSIPKFTINSTLDLKDILNKIGMKHIFNNASGLTEILDGTEATVNLAIQKAVIEVHEFGADEAGSFVPELDTMGKDLDQVIFRADHPFFFYVQSSRDQLMAGVFSEP